LGEKEEAQAAKHINKHDRKSRFLRPKEESPAVARPKPPRRHPRKKEEVGSPVSKELPHCRAHSETMELWGLSQAQEPCGSSQMILMSEERCR